MGCSQPRWSSRFRATSSWASTRRAPPQQRRSLTQAQFLSWSAHWRPARRLFTFAVARRCPRSSPSRRVRGATSSRRRRRRSPNLPITLVRRILAAPMRPRILASTEAKRAMPCSTPTTVTTPEARSTSAARRASWGKRSLSVDGVRHSAPVSDSRVHGIFLRAGLGRQRGTTRASVFSDGSRARDKREP
jgi:hypothetical protein